MAKYIISFKDPDTIDLCTKGANLTASEEKKAKAICQKFFECGEYAFIEIDTDKETAILLNLKSFD